MGPKLILSCVTLLNSDQFLYGRIHNVDRLIQHMLEQFLNKSTACLTWQNELTVYVSSIVIQHIVGLTKMAKISNGSFSLDKDVVGTRYYVVGTRYYVVGTRYYVVGTR